MKQYESPKIEIISFETKDIITSSNDGHTGWEDIKDNS